MTAPPQAPPPSRLSSHAGFEDNLAVLRPELLRFAKLQLRNESLAEDAVQEALTAALANRDDFKNESKLKTWVFSILKNKIIDIVRNQARSFDRRDELIEIPSHLIDESFDGDGRWQPDLRPANWGNPEDSFTERQFLQVLEVCLDRLPNRTAQVFFMREMLGFESAEICKELGISSSNCAVMLHRARMTLRTCVTKNWLNAKLVGADARKYASAVASAPLGTSLGRALCWNFFRRPEMPWAGHEGGVAVLTNCRSASLQISQQMDIGLGVVKAAKLYGHMMRCDGCKALYRNFLHLRVACKRLSN